MPKGDDVTWGDEEMGKLDQGDGNFVIIRKRWNDKGWSGLDVRKHFANDSGQVVPTRKGITLKQDEWDRIIPIIQGGKSSGGGDDERF